VFRVLLVNANPIRYSPRVPDESGPVIIHISPSQKAQLLAGLPEGTAIFDLCSGSFYVPALSHVVFKLVETPDRIQPRNAA
jgi:hypothetical protein